MALCGPGRQSHRADMAASPADAALVDELIVALREERRRAPADLVTMLGIVLVLVALGLLAFGLLVGGGLAQAFLVDLSVETIGLAIGVALIGGVWAHFQATTYSAIDDLVTRIDRFRDRPLTEPERRAFHTVLELHRRARTTGPVRRLATGVMYALRHRERLEPIERILEPARSD